MAHGAALSSFNRWGIQRGKLVFPAAASSSSAKFVSQFSKDGDFTPTYFAWPNNNKKPRVCILGGGFGGLYTALRLESLVWPEDKKHQISVVDCAKMHSIVLHIWFWVARLVLALGAESKLDVVPGAAEFSLPFSTMEDACKVGDKLKALERKNFGKKSPTHVAVVGCCYSGVELAATLSERLQDKEVVQAINVGNTILSDAPSGRENMYAETVPFGRI